MYNEAKLKSVEWKRSVLKSDDSAKALKAIGAKRLKLPEQLGNGKKLIFIAE